MSKQNKCKNCGQVINPMNSLCTDCSEKNNLAEFRKVREFLYSNPGANINAIIKGTGVDGKKIFEYLQKGSLNLKV